MLIVFFFYRRLRTDLGMRIQEGVESLHCNGTNLRVPEWLDGMMVHSFGERVMSLLFFFFFFYFTRAGGICLKKFY